MENADFALRRKPPDPQLGQLANLLRAESSELQEATLGTPRDPTQGESPVRIIRQVGIAIGSEEEDRGRA